MNEFDNVEIKCTKMNLLQICFLFVDVIIKLWKKTCLLAYYTLDKHWEFTKEVKGCLAYYLKLLITETFCRIIKSQLLA